jgi:hypothetical protein
MILSISRVAGCSLYITCCGRVFTLLSFGLGGGEAKRGKGLGGTRRPGSILSTTNKPGV